MSSSHNRKTSARHTAGIGIDAGGDSARLVCMEASGGEGRVVSYAVINARREGLIGTGELAEAAAHWMTERGTPTSSACVTLPPFAPTETVLALPGVVPENELKNLVYLQTRALCTISDDKFLHEYQLQPSAGKKPTVVIMLVRESAVDEQYRLFSSRGVSVAQMSSHGLAAVNALLALHEHDASSAKLQLVLNVEAEFCTLSGLQSGELLFQTWLSFGMGHFAEAPAAQMQALKSEISNILDHWYESAKSDQPVSLPQRLWVTGSGVLDDDFLELLRNAYARMEMRVFGMPVAEDVPHDGELPRPYAGMVRPEMTVAYGLALQNCGLAKLNVSILPSIVKWQRERRGNFPLLAMGAAAFCVGLLTLYVGILVTTVNDIRRVEAQADELAKCTALAPKIKQMHEKIEFYQKEMLPVAEIGYRTRRFVEALELWNQALTDNASGQKQNWGIYLADEISFGRANADKPADASDGGETPASDASAGTMVGPATDHFMMDMYRAPLQQADVDNFKFIVTNVKDMRFLKGLYVGGITPLGESRYKVVKEIQTRLQQSGAYVNVDDHIDFLVKTFSERYFTPWLEFLKTNKSALNNDFTIFFLRVPFRKEYINPAAMIPDVKPSKKRSGGKS